MGRDSFDIRSRKNVVGRAEVGTADASGKYTMTKPMPRGPDFAYRATAGSGKGTNTNSEALMGNEKSWSNPKDGRGF